MGELAQRPLLLLFLRLPDNRIRNPPPINETISEDPSGIGTFPASMPNEIKMATTVAPAAIISSVVLTATILNDYTPPWRRKLPHENMRDYSVDHDLLTLPVKPEQGIRLGQRGSSSTHHKGSHVSQAGGRG